VYYFMNSYVLIYYIFPSNYWLNFCASTFLWPVMISSKEKNLVNFYHKGGSLQKKQKISTSHAIDNSHTNRKPILKCFKICCFKKILEWYPWKKNQITVLFTSSKNTFLRNRCFGPNKIKFSDECLNLN
jgi:hypothetical protein